MRVQQPRDHVFPGTGFPLNQHRGLRRRHLRDLCLHRPPGLAGPLDDRVLAIPAVPRRQILAAKFPHRAKSCESGLHGRAVERGVLDEEIPRAVFHRSHGVFDVAMAGQDDHIDVRLMLLHPAQDRPAVETGHAEIGDDAVEGGRTESIEAFLPAARRLRVAAFLSERLFHDETDKFFVVDNEGAHVFHGHEVTLKQDEVKRMAGRRRIRRAPERPDRMYCPLRERIPPRPGRHVCP